MRILNIHDAKTHFSKLIHAVTQGDEIVIASAGKPVARLCRLQAPPKRQFGVLKGKLKIAKDFDAPLPDAILEDFENA